MNELPKDAFDQRPDLHVETEGEFKGWRTWTRDNFETHNGPFWHRMDENGRVQCAFRVEKKHLNGMRNVHGGCFMTFADYCLFAFAAPVLLGGEVVFPHPNREELGLPDTTVRHWLRELVELEYLLAVEGGGRGKTVRYRLSPRAPREELVLGLLTPEELRAKWRRSR